MLRLRRTHASAGVELKVIGALHVAAGVGTTGDTAVLLVVVELQVDAAQAGLNFRHHALRGGQRVEDGVEVVKDGAVLKARIIRLAGFQGKLAAKTQARRDHNATTKIHEDPARDGVEYKLPSPKVLMSDRWIWRRRRRRRCGHPGYFAPGPERQQA